MDETKNFLEKKELINDWEKVEWTFEEFEEKIEDIHHKNSLIEFLEEKEIKYKQVAYGTIDTLYIYLKKGFIYLNIDAEDEEILDISKVDKNELFFIKEAIIKKEKELETLKTIMKKNKLREMFHGKKD